MRFLLALKSVALATFFLFSFEATAQDASCELTIEANDRMQFSALTMEAPASCTEITVTLTHTGQLPREGMGHNWVLTNPADFNDVPNEGMKAGLANNYMPVAHTCFFQCELPQYSTIDIMRAKLRYAIFNCQAIDGDDTGVGMQAAAMGWED